MPVLSLPLSLTGTLGTPPSVWFPLRIPFTMIPRIGSILPASINGPFKSSLMALFRLAWSNKIQLPLLITVCFMAFDIRLQLEINIFWEPPRPTAARQQRDRAQRIANANLEAIRAAAVNAALVQRQRQRQYLEQLARHEREMRNFAMMRHASDIEGDDDDDNEDARCGFSTSEEDEDGEVSKSISTKSSLKKDVKDSIKLKQKRKKRKLNEEEDQNGDGNEDDDDDDDESEDSSSDGDEDDDDEDGDDDDESGSGASQNPHPDYFGDSDRDDDDDFYEGRDRSGDETDDSDSTGGIAPLVVELEIRQRSASWDESWFTHSTKSIIKNISILLPTTTATVINKLLFRENVHHHHNHEEHLKLNSCHVVPSCDKSSDAGHHLKWKSSSLMFSC